MKRKDYKKPTMDVVKMKYQSQLLAGNSDNAGVQNYNWHVEDEE